MYRVFNLVLSLILFTFLFACGGGGDSAQPNTGSEQVDEGPPITLNSELVNTSYLAYERIKLHDGALYAYMNFDKRFDRYDFDSDQITTIYESNYNSEGFHDALFSPDPLADFDLFSYLNRDFVLFQDRVFNLNHPNGSFSDDFGINSFSLHDRSPSVVGASPSGERGNFSSVTSFRGHVYWLSDSNNVDERHLFRAPSQYLKSGETPHPSFPFESLVPTYNLGFSTLHNLTNAILIYDRSEGCIYTFYEDTLSINLIRCDKEELSLHDIHIEGDRVFLNNYASGNGDRALFQLDLADGSKKYIKDIQVEDVVTTSEALYSLSYADSAWSIEKFDFSSEICSTFVALQEHLTDSNNNYPTSYEYFVRLFVAPEFNQLIVLERFNRPEVGVMKHVFSLDTGEYQSSNDISSYISDFNPDNFTAVYNQYLYFPYSKLGEIFARRAIFDLVNESQVQPDSIYWAPLSRNSNSTYFNFTERSLIQTTDDTVISVELDHYPAPVELHYYQSEDVERLDYRSLQVTDDSFYYLEYDVTANSNLQFDKTRIQRRDRETNVLSTLVEFDGHIRDLVKHNGYLYYVLSETDSLNYSVQRLDLLTNEIEPLVQITNDIIPVFEYSYSTQDVMLFSRDRIIFTVYIGTNSPKNVYSFDLVTGELKALIDGLVSNITDIATDGEYLYYTNDSSFNSSRVLAVSLEGGEPFVIRERQDDFSCVTLEYREADRSLYAGCGRQLLRLYR
ncbi:hypothetical protein FLL45_04320 [Aliikangiella marina]|uniref:Uncharacterized protein n=1 Tax=Aliikangiella marina TaxID=1712262 RepID=A0A545TIX1_9GAMM|nr:hypothetical protein [Aliikangiella marina]TQV77179.1 hypothetical protein FLL45_04320 [Aliikangiella marina]